MARRFGESVAHRRCGLLVAALLGTAAILSAWPWPRRPILAQTSQNAGGQEVRPGPSADRPDQVKRVGRLIRVTLPITGQTFQQVRRSVLKAVDDARSSGSRLTLIFEFEVLPDQEDFARASEFGAAFQLADFLSSERLNEATTVAYVPQTIEGHAVLAVLACEQMVMAADAEIRSAGAGERTITPPILAAYKDIANRRKTIPAEVALGLVDPSRKVLEVETDISREYILAEDLEKLRQQRTIRSTRVLFEAGQPGRLSGEEARQLDFVAFKASDRRELARGLGLRPEAVEEDPSLSEPWRAVRVDLKGPINAETTDQVQRMIEDGVRRDNVNFVCLWIDSPGGSPTDSAELADFLAFDLDPSKVRTVAYIPSEALADAALVALACDQVVMRPRALLGGPGSPSFSEEEIALARHTIREAIAIRKTRSWSLPVAMIDPELEVFRCRYTRLGAEQYFEYFCEEELAEQAESEDWRKEQRVTRPGKSFQANGREAVDYWLADNVVDDFTQFKRRYGLENDPALLEPGWADFLIDALSSPGLAILLLIIGGAALYAELQAPGVGVGGFIAAMCFLLFFWSRFLGHTAGWLEVTLFVAGISFLLLEVFVLPGFGIFGLGGGLLVIISLVLASQTFILPRNDYQFAQLQRSLLMLAGAGAGVIAAAVMINRWLPKAPMFGHLILEPPVAEETETRSHRESLVDFSELLDVQGTALTPLVPAGKARFGDRRLDVVADGEFIERGARVVVVEIQGNRIVVRPAEEVT